MTFLSPCFAICVPKIFVIFQLARLLLLDKQVNGEGTGCIRYSIIIHILRIMYYFAV